MKKQAIKTKYGPYMCAFTPEKDMGGFAVVAQKVPGAISWGKNLAQAKKMIAEAIEGAIEGEIIIAAHKAGRISVKASSKIKMPTQKTPVLV